MSAARSLEVLSSTLSAADITLGVLLGAQIVFLVWYIAKAIVNAHHRPEEP